jgi:hypothetical protein
VRKPIENHPFDLVLPRKESRFDADKRHYICEPCTTFVPTITLGGEMKTKLAVAATVLCLLSAVFAIQLFSTPSLNGTTPGCGPASSCHTFQSGVLSVTQLGNLQVRLTITGNSGNVAGELVDSAGSVVAVNNSTGTNPFTLTAPHAGTYTVNGGFRSPTPRRWDSLQVVLTLTGVGEGENGVTPSQMSLDQNYPNPFNPSTRIPYRILISGPVRLTITDLTGKEVAVLVDGWQHSGMHTVTWNAEQHASGVYLCRLQSGGYSEARKVLLLR